MNKWTCPACGQAYSGYRPPSPCPTCGSAAAADPVAQSTAYQRESTERFVVIGGGGAGAACVSAIRERDKTASLTIVCGENDLPYNRPALPYALSGKAKLEDISLGGLECYGRNGITVLRGVRAVSASMAERRVLLSDGQRLEYDKLLIATGAKPLNPLRRSDGDVPLAALHTREDAEFIAARAENARVAVLGGGILGIETAAALASRGARVTLIQRDSRLLPTQTDEYSSARLRAALEALGADIILENSIAALGPDGAALTGGGFLKSDLVVVCVGARPDTTLAKTMGLAVKRGIVVDSAMRTSAPDVYAAGDCAEFAGACASRWNAAVAQGEVAGAQMAGDQSVLYAERVSALAFATDSFSLLFAGRMTADRVRRDIGGVYRCLAFEDGRLSGAFFIGGREDSRLAVKLVSSGAPYPECAWLLGE